MGNRLCRTGKIEPTQVQKEKALEADLWQAKNAKVRMASQSSPFLEAFIKRHFIAWPF